MNILHGKGVGIIEEITQQGDLALFEMKVLYDAKGNKIPDNMIQSYKYVLYNENILGYQELQEGNCVSFIGLGELDPSQYPGTKHVNYSVVYLKIIEDRNCN